MTTFLRLPVGLNATSFPPQDRVRRRDCGVSSDTLIVFSPDHHDETETNALAPVLRDRSPRGVRTARPSSPKRVQHQPGFRPRPDRTADRTGNQPAPVSGRGAFLSAPPNCLFSVGEPISFCRPSCCHTPTARKLSPQSGPARRRTGRCGCLVPASSGTVLIPFPPNRMSKEPTPNKPWKVLRSSGVSASIFENSVRTKDGEVTYFKVSLTRTYRDGEEWKSTTSLSREDLPIAALLLQQAWAAIVTAEAAPEN